MTLFKEKIECAICKESFENRKSLHRHLRVHNIYQKDYYEEYFPKRCPYCGLLIPFKGYEEYQETFFYSKFHAKKYFSRHWNSEEAKKLALEMLKKRIESKGLRHAPTCLEMKTLSLPSVEDYVKMFGSYFKACKLINVPLLFSKPLVSEVNKDFSEEVILIDTREQKPLKFKNGVECKLDIGDYTLPRDRFTNTFIDRKSEGDFKGTMCGGYERFKRELERCRTLGCFLYILVECAYENMEANNHYGKHSSNLNYVFHNMRTLQHEYSDCCQFIFSGGRRNSAVLIPKLLSLGDKLWGVDLQYFVDRKLIHELD